MRIGTQITKPHCVRVGNSGADVNLGLRTSGTRLQ